MRCLAILVAFAAALPAAETVLADLRFAIGAAPLPDEAEGVYTDVSNAPLGLPAGSPRVDTYESGATAVAAEISGTFGRLAPVGLVWGGALRYCNGEMQLESIAYPSADVVDERAEFEAQGFEVDSNTWTTIGLAAHAGIGWAFARGWHAEAVGILGGDWLTLDTFSVVQAGTTYTVVTEGSGPGWTWGGRIGAYWTDAESAWQFGVQAEWTTTSGTVRTDYDDNSVEFDVEAVGLGGKLVIGHRF